MQTQGQESDRIARAILRARAARSLMVRKAREDLPTFIRMVARDENGLAIPDLNPLQRWWCCHVLTCWNRGYHAMIWAPFGSGKSSTFAIPLCCFLIGRNRQVRIKVVSNADTFAAARVSGAKKVLESPEFREIFPEVRRGETWSNQQLFVKRQGNSLDPTLHARGVLTTGVGGRADFLVFDDCVDLKNSYSEQQRNRVDSEITKTWMSRLHPVNGRALTIATPWHSDDANARRLRDASWVTLVQRVAEDFSCFRQDVTNPFPGYFDEAVTLYRAFFGEHEMAAAPRAT